MTEQRVRLSVDIGGTFTDVVLDRGTTRFSTKVLTTHQAPEVGLLDGANQLCRQVGITWRDIDLFLHGTTLATNAIIERRGARTALLTTEGFRDTIEIGTESRHDQYDIFLKKPVPLVPRDLRFTVSERLNVRGDVLRPLDEAGLDASIEQLRQREVQSLAISFIHAYADGKHERRAREIISKALPGLSISISSEVCPEVREYERASTTCANAYVRPVMANYLGRLAGQLKELGFTNPVLLMSSGGGLTTIEQASNFPIRLVESGPAGGAILAAKVARECDLDEIVSFDMGGTTAKLCLIDGGKPLKSRTFEVDRTERFLKGSGLPVRIPVIEMVEIGAGGGSIARVDELGRVAVGPESASSEPGPAAYGRGGTRPTVSDADLALGRLDKDRFAGGKLKLRDDLARAALEEHIGKPLSIDWTTSALAISEMVEENMANASRVHAAEFGKDLRRRALVAFGGAAPLHAARLATKLGLSKVIIPRGAGVGSAIGFLEAPVAYEVVKSYHTRLDGLETQRMRSMLDAMAVEAAGVVAPAAEGKKVEVKAAAFMRYVGQGHELEVAVPPADSADLVADFKAAFTAAYARVFSRALHDHAIEIVTWTVTATALDDARETVHYVPTDATGDSQIGTCEMFDPELNRVATSPVHWRERLRPGVVVQGPAVIAEEETSTVVTSSFSAQLNALGHIELTRAVEGNSMAADQDSRATQAAASSSMSEIDFQIMWNRLIAIVEEQAQALRRTAFSPIVRESGDLSAGFFDAEGRMVAQAVTGTPGHVNTMAASVLHFLRLFPADTMRDGDVFVTNDPWMGTGHLHDFVTVTPTFHKGRFVGLFASTCHFMDVGGIGFGPDGRDVFEEGFYIPPMRVIDAGEVDRTLVTLVRVNSRYPAEAEGDLFSLIASNNIGVKRLSEMLDGFALNDLQALSNEILSRSRKAVLKEIAKLPKGVTVGTMTMDGYDRPVTIKATLTVTDEGLEVDYSGTSGLSARGINVPLSYTQAYTAFGLGCSIFPNVPNNSGTLSVLKITAPEGSILNAERPAPVSSRHVIGQTLPDVVFNCLAQLTPERVMAEGAAALWNLILEDAHDACVTQGIPETRRFSALSVLTGGTGARFSDDGLNATAFPSGVSGVPIEVIETITPLIYWRKELREGSGGRGKFNGGQGQIVEIGHRDGHPFYLFAALDRIHNPAKGRFGGEGGAPGSVALGSGRLLNGKGKQLIPKDDTLVVQTPGGGGYGKR